MLILFVIVTIFTSFTACRPKNPKPTDDTFKGTLKAIQVEEKKVLVYKSDATNNIIPGYARYRIQFIEGDRKAVKLTEYTGEVFEGLWDYDKKLALLTFYDLQPMPYYEKAYNFGVSLAVNGEIILTSKYSNPKTGNTINEYTLVPE